MRRPDAVLPRRRTVRCWRCGNKKRRVPGARPAWWFDLTASGRLHVVGKRRTVQPYGICRKELPWGERCGEVMLLPVDARFVLRAAIAHERRGGNRMSEYD